MFDNLPDRRTFQPGTTGGYLVHMTNPTTAIVEGAPTLIAASLAGTWVDFVGSVIGNPTVRRQVYMPLIMK